MSIVFADDNRTDQKGRKFQLLQPLHVENTTELH
jgi:hypothetical protein